MRKQSTGVEVAPSDGDPDQVIRGMSKASRVKYLIAAGWVRVGSTGPQSWRSPTSGDRGRLFTLAAAIRTAVSRDRERDGAR